MKKIILLVVGIIFIAGCQNTKKPLLPSPEITIRHCYLQPFTSLTVSGNAKVELINGPYGVEITGIQNNKDNCPYKINRNTLLINNSSDLISNAVIKVSAPELRKLTVTDSAIISARDFIADKLTIAANEHGTINIEGRLNIDKIFQYGRGMININWVDSTSLLIEAHNNGPICLGGKTKNLVVKLLNDATLHARYLRAQNASVFTADGAVAEILVFDVLGAYAIDKSNIYYYKKPKNLTIVTRNSANVLHPHWVQ